MLRGGDRVGPEDLFDEYVDERPDPSRPRNPWPRLLAFGFIVLLALVIVGACTVALIGSTPPRELRVDPATLVAGAPRFFPAPSMGADAEGYTFGTWVVRLEDNEIVALLSRDPGTACHVEWRTLEVVEGRRGVFADRCSAARYALDGSPLAGDPVRALETFETRIEQREVVVEQHQLTLGACGPAAAEDAAEGRCSTAGEPVERRFPSGRLSADPAELPGRPPRN